MRRLSVWLSIIVDFTLPVDFDAHERDGDDLLCPYRSSTSFRLTIASISGSFTPGRVKLTDHNEKELTQGYDAFASVGTSKVSLIIGVVRFKATASPTDSTSNSADKSFRRMSHHRRFAPDLSKDGRTHEHVLLAFTLSVRQLIAAFKTDLRKQTQHCYNDTFEETSNFIKTEAAIPAWLSYESVIAALC
ncbi:hypothetical protein A4X13_0g8844 [Tilletia indica]|uniref:Uncharacterized protein n=1 Tax=Tilletia indica TaxID=43049 RepID=A0A177T1E4_9BASI|nr:hypothetical protein A4X13_0g8844 [Tilletia indica]